MDGRYCALLVTEDFFVEFLSVTKTGVPDFYALGPREGNHSLGKIDNLHRLTHIEHENLASPAHRAGLKNQTAGLRNQHKVTDDVRVGNRNGTSTANLLLENRNHASV